MNVLPQRILLAACVLALTACSMLDNEKSAGTFSGDNVLHIATPVAVKTEIKNSAVLRITPYVDQRSQKNPRVLGVLGVRVFGLTGNELVIDQDVSSVATHSIQRQFAKNGFEVVEDGATTAPVFELSGNIKELTLNTKDRDDITLAIETSVKEIASGKIIWTALVTEKNNRFAGVSGNTKGDLVDYLNREMRIVSDKTVEGVSTLLMATHPALFNLTPGTKTIAGVSVYTAPIAPVLPPSISAPEVVAPASVGTLSLTSQPSRAKVYLDEVYYGLTPLRVELPSGVHSVMVKQVGYQTATEKVSVRKGEQTELEIQLAR